MPTWKSGRRDILAPSKRSGFSPFWVDIYLRDILYVLKNPLQGGRISTEDAKAMGLGVDMMVLPASMRIE